MRLARFYRTVHGHNHHWWVFSVTSIGTFMNTYDLGAVNISLPQMMASFQTSFTLATWVLLAYLLTSTVLLLPAGRLADMIGRKKVYNLGFLIFALGSGLCGLSQDPTQLIIFRVIQASGISLVQTSSFAITAAVFPEKELGKGLGFGMTMAAIGASSGPALGGLIVDMVGWRGIFFLNVMVALIGTLLGYLIIQEKVVSTISAKTTRHFDLGGAVLSGVAVSSLLLGLSFWQEGSWSSWQTLFFLGVAAGTTAVFPWYEIRQAHPLVDMKLLKNRNFAFNNTARFIFFLALSANVLLMPFFLQIIQGYSPLQAGLLIAPMNVVIALVSPVAGWLTNHITSRTLASAGMAIIGLSFYLQSQLTSTSSPTDVLVALLLLGLGYGIFQTPNNTSVMDSVPREKFGLASGILSLVRQTGQSVGVALASTIVLTTMFPIVGRVSLFSLKREQALLGQADALNAFAAGIQQAFLAAALLCAVAVVFCLMRSKTARDEGEHAHKNKDKT